VNCDLGVCGDESKRRNEFVGKKVELSLGWTYKLEVLVRQMGHCQVGHQKLGFAASTLHRWVEYVE